MQATVNESLLSSDEIGLHQNAIRKKLVSYACQLHLPH